MAKKHVIAYFMHESERREAVQAMTSAEVTESFVMGELEESGIQALQQQGSLR